MLLSLCVPVILSLAAVEGFSVRRSSPEDALSINERDTQSLLRRRRSYFDDAWLPPYDFPREIPAASYDYRPVYEKRGRIDDLIRRLSRTYGTSNSRGHPMRFATGR